MTCWVDENEEYCLHDICWRVWLKELQGDVMKIGKHVEEALRTGYEWACADIKQQNEYIERDTRYLEDYQKRINESKARREEAIAKKVEIRTAMIKLGIDPEAGIYP